MGPSIDSIVRGRLLKDFEEYTYVHSLIHSVSSSNQIISFFRKWNRFSFLIAETPHLAKDIRCARKQIAGLISYRLFLLWIN